VIVLVLLLAITLVAYLRGARGWSLLFWGPFVLYVAAVVMWLVVGLLPSVTHESRALHSWLHDRAGDELRAGAEVVVYFENDDDCVPEDPGRCELYNLTLLADDGRVLYSGPLVEVGRSAVYRFTAPAPGVYRIESAGHPDVASSLRFGPDGADSIRIRLAGPARYAKAGLGSWDGLAQRIADASHRADPGGRVTRELLFSVVNLGLGILLIVRRPNDRIVRLLAVGMVGTAATFNHQSHIVLKDALLPDWGQHDLFHLGSGMAYVFAVLVFPDGGLVPRVMHVWARWLLRVGYAVAAWLFAGYVLFGSSTSHPGQTEFTVLFGLAIPLVGFAAQTYRLRRESDPERRQQERLLRWALSPMLVAGVAYYVLVRVVGPSASDAYGITGSNSRIEEVGLAVFPALFALIPIALVVGILRYRLWDIDVLISKTLLSVGLAAFIGGVYVVVVVVLGHAVGPGDSAAFKIAATAIAAVAFEPVRERLQRLADRLVYGERATPYEVMAQFADQLAGVVSVDEVLPRTAETVARGVGAAACRVTAFLPGGGERTVHWPAEGTPPTSLTRTVTVGYRGETVGTIAVAEVPGERLTPADEALLNSLASQAGLAFNNARLTIELRARLQEISAQAADLRASRQRIVTARQVQRQRVVQLIHERVETRLVAAGAGLEEVERLLPVDGDRARDCFDDLLARCGESLDALRDLARGIFPAVLADQGVVPALHAYVLQAALPVDVDIDGPSERFEPSAETSVYFCIVQALENAGTYAAGSRVTVRLIAEVDRLAFSAADDGPGVDPVRLAQGADVQDMRDRVEAVGGVFEARSAPGRGTVVSGWVPARSLATA
jgi:signal transduction histidine kinase